MQSVRASVRLALLVFCSVTLAPPRLLDGQAITPRGAADTWRLDDSTAVAAALSHFLTAFENLDWVPFRASFADSATIFQPVPEMAERVTGPRAIDSTFRAVFANIRSHATGGPPYQSLVPIDLRIQPLSPGLVLVTFELHNAERVARRTVVFRRERLGWRILHLHASNITTKR